MQRGGGGEKDSVLEIARTYARWRGTRDEKAGGGVQKAGRGNEGSVQ
jgi:hypothetical protein